MILPSGVTEVVALDTIERVVAVLAPQFNIGGMDRDDIKQEARIFAMRAISKYDPSRGSLDCYTYRSVKNRLLNLHRNLCYRTDPPCERCHNGDKCGDDGDCCRKYRRWRERQDAKCSLRKNASPEQVPDKPGPGDLEKDAATREMLDVLDAQLDGQVRADFLRLKDGCPIPHARRAALEDAVLRILHHNNFSC